MSGDRLWEVVASYFGDPGQELQFRRAAENLQECNHCVVLGGGIVVKCNVERCRREYHFECAFKKGGFYCDSISDIDEDENKKSLNFYCDVHHKPPLFCICQQPYDVLKEMVCCDECIEWYHNNCLKLNPKETAKMEAFVCPKCTALKRAGQPIPTQEIARNEKKEQRSTCQQNANKTLRILVEIVEAVCPIIDQINTSHEQPGPFSYDQIEEVDQYLSSDLFAQLNIDYTATTVTTTTTPEPIDFFGTETLIRGYRELIKAFIAGYKQWKADVKDMSQSIRPTLSALTLAQTDVDTIEAHTQQVHGLIDTLKRLSIPADGDEELAFLTQYEEIWGMFKQYLTV